MAEVLGVLASAATLFQLCIQGFDFIHTVQQQEADLRKLSIQLSIEKCRLYTWGETMGLTKKPSRGRKIALEHCRFTGTVVETLRLVLELLDNSQTTREKYGCEPVEAPQGSLLTPETEQSKFVQQLNASFSNFKIRGKNELARSTIMRKTSWAIRDKRKFKGLIADAKELIDGLQDITRDIASSAMQQQIIGQRIQTINDFPALETLAEVCKDDYPSFSDAASFRADSLTSHDTIHQGILEWTCKVESDDDDNSDTMTVEAMESMTVTELKYKLSSALFRNRNPKQQTFTTDGIAGDGSARIGVQSETTIATYDPPAEISATSSSTMVDKERAAILQPDDIVQAPPLWEHLKESDTPDTPGDDFAEAELQRHEEILGGMACAALDCDLMNEISAILQWFRVLSSHERSYATYRLYQEMDQQQAKFFSMLYRHKAGIERALVPSNNTTTKNEHKLQQLADAGTKGFAEDGKKSTASPDGGLH